MPTNSALCDRFLSLPLVFFSLIKCYKSRLALIIKYFLLPTLRSNNKVLIHNCKSLDIDN